MIGGLSVKILRTMLYGDCEFQEWELELMHTPVMQRMYNLKQLGFADRVYPDAVHSRFNHIIGVTSRADKIIDGVLRSLKKESKGNLPDRERLKYDNKSMVLKELIEHVCERKSVVRLIGILHDIGHIPFGHTLEDELNIFSVKHDDPGRQVQFFNILLTEFIYALCIRYNPNTQEKLLDIVNKNDLTSNEYKLLINDFITVMSVIENRYEPSVLKEIKNFLIDLQTSMIALFYLEGLHKDEKISKTVKENEENIDNLFINKLLKECNVERENCKKEFDLYLDAFMLDIIGNTICADLLDYAKRDSKFAGLQHDYDDRIFKYFTLVSYSIQENDKKAIRLCLQLFTNKIRYDGVSEIVTIFRTRYLLSERVLFHPTKCGVGAMLGASVYMMGIDRAGLDFFRIGDAVFMKILEKHVKELLNNVLEVIKAIEKSEEIKQKTINDFTDVFDEKSELRIYFDILSKCLNDEKYDVKDNDKHKAFIKIIKDELEDYHNGQYMEGLFVDKDKLLILLQRVQERLYASKRILWQVQSRQYYAMVFRVAKIENKASNDSMRVLANKYNKAHDRYLFEREIEERAGLPYGAILIHCPKYDTALKAAKVIVFGKNPEKAIQFEKIKEDDELYTLKPYIDEAISISNAYKCIWNMYFYLQKSLMHKWPLIEQVIQDMLREKTKSETEIKNSSDLHYQLKREYRIPAKHHLEMIKYMNDPKCPLPNKYNVDMANYVEEAVFNAQKKSITAEEMFSEYLKSIMIQKERKKEK